MTQDLSQNAIVALNAMAEAFAPKEKKAKEDKHIVVINGRISTDFMTDTEITETARRLATTSVKIEKFSSVGMVTVELPVAIPTMPVAYAAEEAEVVSTSNEQE